MTTVINLILMFLTLYLLLNSQNLIFVSVTIILLLTTISFSYPLFSFLFMALISGGLLIVIFPYNLYDNFLIKRQSFITNLLTFMQQANIVEFFSIIYIKCFCIPHHIFRKRLLFLFILNIAYIFLSRWYFYHSKILHEDFTNTTNIFIFLGLFLGIATVYTRLLINLSIFFTKLVLRTDKTLLPSNVLYILGEEGDSPLPPKNISTTPIESKKPYSFFNLNITRNYYRQSFSTSNTSLYRGFGIGLGVGTFLVASTAAYYTKIQADAAMLQVQAQIENNAEMRRQNDLEELSQGIIDRPEYDRRRKKIP